MVSMPAACPDATGWQNAILQLKAFMNVGLTVRTSSENRTKKSSEKKKKPKQNKTTPKPNQTKPTNQQNPQTTPLQKKPKQES